MTAKRCDDTEVKCDRYCWTSLLEPTLLRVWMTMPRVLRSVSCLVDVERAARRAHWARRVLATAGAAARGTEDTGSRAHRRAPARKALTEVESIVARRYLGVWRRRGRRVSTENARVSLRSLNRHRRGQPCWTGGELARQLHRCQAKSRTGDEVEVDSRRGKLLF